MTTYDQSEDLARMYKQMTIWNEVPGAVAARSSAEPQQFYVESAKKCPVLYTDDGTPILLSMNDIRYVNKHRSVEQSSKLLGSNRPAIPLGLDGPEHLKYRRLLDPVFTAKRVEPLAEQVERLAEAMIDDFADLKEIDAYRRWCEPLPSRIFLSIMGLPMEDLPAFLEFKELTLGNQNVEQESLEETNAKKVRAVEWIQGYFNAALDERERRDQPTDDILGWLLDAEAGGDRLSRDDVLDILGLLIIAGLDTVAASLACFLSFLARHPAERAGLVADPSGWPSAVEELMRFESPVTDGGRITHEDLELPSGEKIPAGSLMITSWAASGMDPEYFPEPLSVDLARSPNPHVGFASGFHRCLGSHLARMEMVTALKVWHRRIPEYRIKPGVDLVYSGNPRAPHHLPLEWS